MVHEKNQIITIKELSEYLNCSISMIRKMIYNNEIPYFKIGNKYHFNIEIVNKWIISRHNDIEIGDFNNEIK